MMGPIGAASGNSGGGRLRGRVRADWPGRTGADRSYDEQQYDFKLGLLQGECCEAEWLDIQCAIEFTTLLQGPHDADLRIPIVQRCDRGRRGHVILGLPTRLELQFVSVGQMYRDTIP